MKSSTEDDFLQYFCISVVDILEMLIRIIFFNTKYVKKKVTFSFKL